MGGSRGDSLRMTPKTSRKLRVRVSSGSDWARSETPKKNSACASSSDYGYRCGCASSPCCPCPSADHAWIGTVSIGTDSHLILQSGLLHLRFYGPQQAPAASGCRASPCPEACQAACQLEGQVACRVACQAAWPVACRAACQAACQAACRVASPVACLVACQAAYQEVACQEVACQAAYPPAFQADTSDIQGTARTRLGSSGSSGRRHLHKPGAEPGHVCRRACKDWH